MSRRTVLLVTGLMLGVPAAALAYSAGPPDARTGAPDELTCVQCHSTYLLNSGSGTLAASGVPGEWTPLADHDLVIQLADPDAMRWGFEFAVLDAFGNSAGTLTPLDAETQTSTLDNRTYAKHTTAGTHAGTAGSSTWTVRWTAPAAGLGELRLYLAGNASNNNGGKAGDRIYNVNQTWSEGAALSASPLPPLAAAELHPNHPNPFNPRTTIAYELARDTSVRLDIHALDGSLVRRLVDGFGSAGGHEASWDGRDRRGRDAPSGIYLYRLVTDAGAVSRRMTLVR